MRKICMGIFVCIMILPMFGCGQQLDRNKLYKIVFDTHLQEDEHTPDMDYISLFIQRDDVGRADFSPIEKSIQETYQKDTYSYTTAELHHSGSYGKENLNEEGIYLYITRVEEADNQVIVHSEKYYTVETLQSTGMKMTFVEKDDGWELIEKIVVWEGSP